MKPQDKLLNSNSYLLITIGCSTIVDGTNPRLGTLYVILGIILVILEWFIRPACEHEKKD